MEFQQLVERARHVRQLYAEHERRTAGAEWSTTDLALGLVGDVGDLVKLVQAKEGLRNVGDVDLKLAHELADCLWSLIVLADRLGIDLQLAFVETLDGLERVLDAS
jgi:NTP pyrophosphatase (non-canonical NTP hydrolase)